MKYALAVMYLAAGMTTASVVIELDRHRCVDDAPITYLVGGAAWPLVGGLIIGMQLAGSASGSDCTVQP